MSSHDVVSDPRRFRCPERGVGVLSQSAVSRLRERLHNALGEGELIENAELEIARSEQAFVEGRILDLEERLRRAQIISRNGPDSDVVGIGSTVTVRERGESEDEEYFVVGSSEADPSNGRISNESPLGQALIGKRVGNKAIVRAPDGDLVFDIKAIR